MVNKGFGENTGIGFKNKMKSILNCFRPWLSVVLLGVFLSSCGYSTKSLLPSRIKTIHISSFKNKVSYTTDTTRSLYLPLLEVKVRNAISDRFLFDGHLRVEDGEVADIVLKGDLTGFEREVLRYTDTNDVQEYRIRITVSLELWDAVKEKTLWSEPSFSGETTYFPTGALAKSENAALEDVLTDLARRVVERTIEDW